VKVSSIIQNIEYRQPAGVKDCKTGWTASQVGEKLALKNIVEEGWTGPGREPTASHDNPNVSEVSAHGLRDELASGKGLRPGKMTAEMELVG